MSRFQIVTGMKILQANMHRSKTADALLEQIVAEEEVDVVIISEQYGRTTRNNWYEDETGTAAIWLPRNSNVAVIGTGSGPGFIYLKSNLLSIVSCYLTPSDSIHEFQTKLDLIEDKAREIGGHLIIAGDLNSKAVEWGMDSTNSRGRCVLDMAARLGMLVGNTGSATTFRRPGCINTTPDITLVSESLYGALANWKVLEDFNGSDHHYITFQIVSQDRPTRREKRTGTRKWNVAKLNKEMLISKIDEYISQLCLNDPDLRLVDATMRCITMSCNASMPKLSTRVNKPSVYWWTDEIAELRRKCFQKRRKFTRAKRHGDALEEAENFRNARKELKAAINRSKKAKWEELRNDLNSNPWGQGYKIVVKKLGARTRLPQLDSSTIIRIVDTLFPTHEQLIDENPRLTAEDLPPPFTKEDLQITAQSLKCNKAPGPDGIPNEVLKLIATERPKVLLDMYNMCLYQGVFPIRWKKQHLMLISKGKGDAMQASTYRPLCMLDSAGKLFEKLLKTRLNKAVKDSGGLSERQHGFRAGRSTIGAINEVIGRVRLTQRGNHFSRGLVLLATLDVRNAFNSLRWIDVIEALKTKFSIPAYLLKMVQSYLSDRELIYDTSEGQKSKRITSGAAQGSILGPELWNISYDDIFRMEMPDDTHLVGYADDVAAIIVARNVEDARRKLNQVLIRTMSWLEDRGLQLATEKTEIILLTRKHIPLEIDMVVSDTTLTTKKVVNYLGIRLDPRLTFWAQIQHAAKKAAETTGLLSKLMANVGGPIQSRRRLLMATTDLILLYGSEIWADALKAECRRKVLSSVQRTAALRVASAYRTVSEPAILVISGVIPIDLQANERKRCWEARREHDQRRYIMEEKRRTLQQWQQRWNLEQRGRWTAKLIPDITGWIQRSFGEVNYYLTQLLSGHGYFSKYLYRMSKIPEANCIYGDAKIDDAEHTFFHCQRWRRERESLEECIGTLTVDNFHERILENENNWNRIARYTELVLKSKKLDLDCGIGTDA